MDAEVEETPAPRNYRVMIARGGFEGGVSDITKILCQTHKDADPVASKAQRYSETDEPCEICLKEAEQAAS